MNQPWRRRLCAAGMCACAQPCSLLHSSCAPVHSPAACCALPAAAPAGDLHIARGGLEVQVGDASQVGGHRAGHACTATWMGLGLALILTCRSEQRAACSQSGVDMLACRQRTLKQGRRVALIALLLRPLSELPPCRPGCLASWAPHLKRKQLRCQRWTHPQSQRCPSAPHPQCCTPDRKGRGG